MRRSDCWVALTNVCQDSDEGMRGGDEMEYVFQFTLIGVLWAYCAWDNRKRWRRIDEAVARE